MYRNHHVEHGSRRDVGLAELISSPASDRGAPSCGQRSCAERWPGVDLFLQRFFLSYILYDCRCARLLYTTSFTFHHYITLFISTSRRSPTCCRWPCATRAGRSAPRPTGSGRPHGPRVPARRRRARHDAARLRRAGGAAPAARRATDVPVLFLTAKDAVEDRSPGSPRAATTTSPSRSAWRRWSPGCAGCCAGPAMVAARTTPSWSSATSRSTRTATRCAAAATDRA